MVFYKNITFTLKKNNISQQNLKLYTAIILTCQYISLKETQREIYKKQELPHSSTD